MNIDIILSHAERHPATILVIFLVLSFTTGIICEIGKTIRCLISGCKK